MSLGIALAEELSYEMANTYAVLERIPDDKLDWKPHVKSMTMRELAGHLVLFPGWAIRTLETESFDISPPGDAPLRPPPRAELPRGNSSDV